MKFLSGVLFVLISLPALGATDEASPILELTNHPGYVPIELAGAATCRIFEDRVQTVRQLGHDDTAVTLTEEKVIQVSGAIESLMQAAAAAELRSEDNFLCDGPSTLLTARNPSGGDRIVIYSTGGCGSPTKIRQGSIGQKLMQMAEVWCPEIHRATP